MTERTWVLRKIQMKTLRKVARLSKKKGYVERSELRDFDMPYVDELIKLQLVENVFAQQYNTTVSGDDILETGSTTVTQWVPVVLVINTQED